MLGVLGVLGVLVGDVLVEEDVLVVGVLLVGTPELEVLVVAVLVGIAGEDVDGVDGLGAPDVAPPTDHEQAATTIATPSNSTDRTSGPGVAGRLVRARSSPPAVVITPACQSRYPQVVYAHISPTGTVSRRPGSRR